MSDDSNKPNAARIYDYILGGQHNFAPDRAAGDNLIAMFPAIQPGMKINRWFMYHIVNDFSQRGFTCILDLASGLPTQGYIHELAPEAHVVYNDVDPVTVAYGKEIIGDNPLVRYVQSDLTEIETLLAVADEHFEGEPKVGICFVGVAYFINDETLKKVLDRLYAWCAPGSLMAMSWLVLNEDDPGVKKMLATYERMGAPLYNRSLEQIQALCSTWTIAAPGLIPMTKWIELGDWRSDEAIQQEGDGYGLLLTKP
jgi:O-methyltransferase involved in polyketide biosynthesis